MSTQTAAGSLLVPILFLASLASCASSAATKEHRTPPGQPPAADEHHYFHKDEQPHDADWGYAGEKGPEHWGDLCPQYSLAKTGKMQSPIDIQGATEQPLPQVTYAYQPAVVNVVYNGHTVEEKEDSNGYIVVEGVRYRLAQFHFHSPSEHTLDGEHAPMEMHLVHKSADGKIAVVSAMIEAGRENAAFAPLWQYMPSEEHRERKSSTTVDVGAMLPMNRHYYRYTGSFTTPPCTEGVLWMVLTTPVQLSQEQIDAFRAVIKDNNRPVQPLNERRLTVSE